MSIMWVKSHNVLYTLIPCLSKNNNVIRHEQEDKRWHQMLPSCVLSSSCCTLLDRIVIEYRIQDTERQSK